MNKPVALIVTVLVIAIIGSVAFTTFKNDDQPTASQQVTETDMLNDSATIESAGRYIDYSESAIADAEGTKLLFFYAPWCPQCRALEKDILAMGVPDGVIIIKVDYDSNQDLRQQYGVTLQTTFVKVDDNGDPLEKYIAYDDPTLAAVKANLL